MSNISLFTDADGERYSNPSIDLIISTVLASNQREWESGSGQAALYWNEHSTKKRIVMTPFGTDKIFLQIFSSENREWHYMSLEEECQGGDTEVYVGGDPWLVPSRLFIGKSVAVEAVKEFYLSGNPSPFVQWIHSDEVKFTENF